MIQGWFKMKNIKGKLEKLNEKDAWEQHIFAYWPIVYRFTEEMAMATNSLGVQISPEALDDAVKTALADEVLLKHVVDTAYQEMGFPCAFCNPLQLCISFPHLVTEPLAKQGENLIDLVYDCVYESAKIACSLGFFIPGKQKV
jgi:hypothetical protein